MVNPFKNQRTSAMSFNDSENHWRFFSHSPARWTPCRGECPILFGGAVSDHHRMTFVRWEFIWHKDLSQVWSLRLQRLNGYIAISLIRRTAQAFMDLPDPTHGACYCCSPTRRPKRRPSKWVYTVYPSPAMPVKWGSCRDFVWKMPPDLWRQFDKSRP